MSEKRSSQSSPIVVKLGGALLAEPAQLGPLWESVAVMRQQTPVIVVHGGGPQATEMARRLGHEPRIVHGRRVTTDVDLDIVQWTMRGTLNVGLVAQGLRYGLRTAGVSGVDGPTLRVRRRPPWNVEGESIDFGWVGDVQSVDTGLLDTLMEAGFTPVVAPLGIDEEGRVYNVNADTVSCAIAGAVGASQYLLVTESGGVRRDPEDPLSLLPECDAELFAQGTEEGWIQGGMRVKLKVAFDALEAGVADVNVLAPDDLIRRKRGTRVLRRAADAATRSDNR